MENLEEFNVQSYYQMVVASIEDVSIDETNRWLVNDSAIALGFFSFTKFLMYHDLDAAQWGDDALLQHPVLQSLLETGFQEPRSTIPDDAQIDEHLNPMEVNHVVDADSSQALAIHDVSQGAKSCYPRAAGHWKIPNHYQPNCGSHCKGKAGAVCGRKDGGFGRGQAQSGRGGAWRCVSGTTQP